jgi:excisionase family DNA binding protein
MKLELGWRVFAVWTEEKMQAEFEPLITSEKAAQLLGIHPKTLQKMARSRKIPAVRVGKYWRFRKSDLDSWVRASVNCSGYAYRSEQETV